MQEHTNIKASGLSEEAIERIIQQANRMGDSVDNLKKGDLIPIMVANKMYVTEYDPEIVNDMPISSNCSHTA